MFYFRFAVKLTDFGLHSLRTEEDLDRCELHFKYLVFFLHNDSKITFVFPLNTLIYDYLIMIGHFQITTAYRWLKGTTKEEEGLARLSYIYVSTAFYYGGFNLWGSYNDLQLTYYK